MKNTEHHNGIKYNENTIWLWENIHGKARSFNRDWLYAFFHNFGGMS